MQAVLHSYIHLPVHTIAKCLERLSTVHDMGMSVSSLHIHVYSYQLLHTVPPGTCIQYTGVYQG